VPVQHAVTTRSNNTQYSITRLMTYDRPNTMGSIKVHSVQSVSHHSAGCIFFSTALRVSLQRRSYCVFLCSEEATAWLPRGFAAAKKILRDHNNSSSSSELHNTTTIQPTIQPTTQPNNSRSSLSILQPVSPSYSQSLQSTFPPSASQPTVSPFYKLPSLSSLHSPQPQSTACLLPRSRRKLTD
jgi:hypothetical protein